jgi:CO/xanthine dehydrogenase FAD-binding subunit
MTPPAIPSQPPAAAGDRVGYFRPHGLASALDLLSRPGARVLAGGTDLYPGLAGLPSGPLVDITGLGVLRGLSATSLPGGGAGWRLGALTTWADLAAAVLPSGLALLAQAAREVGGPQIQNTGTVGGNLCNASPAADGLPALLALDARVELSARDGTRVLPVEDFVRGNRRTALRDAELLTAILIPSSSPRAWSRFVKLGHRRYLVIAIASVASVFDFDEQDRLSACAVAVGACAPVARRLRTLEARVAMTARRALPARLEQALADDGLRELAPIDDVRGTATYRLDAVAELIRRLFAEVSR